jgi:type IV secretory pathway VirB3-like protein
LYRFDESDNYITIFEVNSVHPVHRVITRLNRSQLVFMVVMIRYFSVLIISILNLFYINYSIIYTGISTFCHNVTDITHCHAGNNFSTLTKWHQERGTGHGRETTGTGQGDDRGRGSRRIRISSLCNIFFLSSFSYITDIYLLIDCAYGPSSTTTGS